MTVKINTKDGQIELTDEVIATVVGGAATEIFGVVGMASKNAIKDNKAYKPKSEPFNSLLDPEAIRSTIKLKIIFDNLSKNHTTKNQMISFDNNNQSEIKESLGIK